MPHTPRDLDTPTDSDDAARRTTHVIGHLDGVLDDTMLAALSGTWSMLEHAATTPDAHARAVRSRLFWQTLAPGGEAAAPVSAPLAFEEPYADALSGSDDDPEVDLFEELEVVESAEAAAEATGFDEGDALAA